MLHLPEAHRDRRCIAVTSALPAEGKTTVAVNLAIALAAANRTVLLIDTDLRRGSLHHRLKARQGPGLSDLITSQEVRPGEVIHPTRMPDLMLLPWGPRVQGISEAIVRFGFDRMLQELGQQFDYVILDLPPVLATDDSPTLCTYADWTMFVVRIHYSSPNETFRALEELAIRQVEVPGVVVNAVRTVTQVTDIITASWSTNWRTGRSGKRFRPPKDADLRRRIVLRRSLQRLTNKPSYEPLPNDS